MTRPNLLARAAAVAAMLALAGCDTVSGIFTSDEPNYEELSAQQLYTLAETRLAEGSPGDAAPLFDEVERLYPFSQWAKRAMIMSAFSNYQARRYADARASASRFLDFYPSDPDAPYAQYLIGLSYYDNIIDIGRDQAETEAALQALTEVVRRYPDSDYARDAALKIDLARDHLAGKELQVGRYYLKRGHYIAAINRFRVVIERYQTTSQTPEALHRLVEANLALGLEREAQIAGAILGHNFAGSEWYADSYALLTGRGLEPEGSEDGWLGRIWRRVILGEWL